MPIREFLLSFQAEGQDRRQRQQVHADDERAHRQVSVRPDGEQLGIGVGAVNGAVGAREGRGRHPGVVPEVDLRPALRPEGGEAGARAPVSEDVEARDQGQEK